MATYNISMTKGTGISGFYYGYYDSTNTWRSGLYASATTTTIAVYSGTDVYIYDVSFKSGYTYPVNCGSWEMYTETGAKNDPYIRSNANRSLTISATAKASTTKYSVTIKRETGVAGYYLSYVQDGSSKSESTTLATKTVAADADSDVTIVSITPESGYGSPYTLKSYSSSSATTPSSSWDWDDENWIDVVGTRYIGISATLQEQTYYGRFTLNANGGSFPGTGYTSISWPTGGVMSGTGTSGAYVSTTLPASGGNYVPTRSGYTFVGWATSSAATTPNYYSGGTAGFTAKSTSSSSPTTIPLYAVWEEATYTLTITCKNSNGTQIGGNSITGITSGTKYTMSTLGSTYNPNSNYYEYSYATNSSGTTITSITVNSNTSVNLYYNDITYSLKYRSQFTGVSGLPNDVEGIQYGATRTISSTTPTRAGYKFLGWSTNVNATSADYEPGDSITINSNVLLYTVFEKEFYTLSMTLKNSNGSQIGAASISDIAYGTSYTASTLGEEHNPNSNYYEYSYCSNSSGTTITSLTVTSNTSINLHYTDKTYTVQYRANVNGVSGLPENVEGINYDATHIVTSVTPVRAGYKFIGWSTDYNATSAEYVAGNEITIRSDMILYTVWQEEKYKLTIYLKKYGGTQIGGDAIEDIAYGTTYNLSELGNEYNPNSNSYLYSYGTNSSGTTVESITVTENTNVSLYYEDRTYTLWYRHGSLIPDGNGVSNMPNSEEGIKYGATRTISSIKPVKAGYEFIGWSTDYNATSPEYIGGEEITITSEVILYTVWGRTYKISIQSDESISSLRCDYTNGGEPLTSSVLSPSFSADAGTKVVLSAEPNDGYNYPIIATSYTSALFTTVDGTWSLSNDNSIDVDRDRYVSLSATVGERTYYYRVDYVCDGELVGSSPVTPVVGADDSGYTVYVDELPPLDYYDNTGEYEAGAYCTFDGAAFTIQPFSSGETTYEDPAVFIAYVSKSLYTLRLHFMLTTNVELNYFEEYDIPAETYISAYDYCDLYNPDPNLYTYAYAKDVNGSIVDGVTIMEDTDLYLYYTGEYYYAQLELDPNGGHWEDGYTGSAYYPDYQESEYQIIDIIVPDYEPLRDGYVFKGWTIDGLEYVYTAGNVVSVTSMSFDASMPTVQRLSAYWVPKIQHFYWSGSDESDAQLIAPGKSQGNLTAERWNSLLAMISELAIACGAPFSYAPVSGRINAVLFNNAVVELTNISNALGVSVQIPGLQSKDGIMYASTLNGPQSIKGALNELIDVYNEG